MEGTVAVTMDSVLGNVGTVLDAAVGWVGTVSGVVASNPLLLVGVVLSFVGVGVGLFSRLLRV